VIGRFLWGAATSSYQIEGAVANDWTDWEAAGRLHDQGERCGAAAGHRQRWKADFALLPSIGANAYRFSMEWSRIEPTPGKFDPVALALERERVKLLRRLGIEPVVTLHHFTHPRWFQAEGGWESPQSVERFGRFARAVASALAPHVSVWVTVNEPIVLLLGGYLGGLMPPGRRSFSAAAKALEHILRAHEDAAGILREESPAGARVGLAHNMLEFAPDRSASAIDRRLSQAGERLYNRALVEAVATGEVDWAFPGEGRVRFRLPDWPAAHDYLGVNYYSRVHLRFRGIAGPVGEYLYRDRHGRGLTEMGWEVRPEGFDGVLRTAAEAGRPILVMENGIAARDDHRRRDFLREHALVLAHRRAAGTPVEGYFYWSLLDNFEWLEGFRPRFGLFDVDYATFARRRRPSADLFAELARAFMVPATGAASFSGARS
jgi:beta-glucosidase